MVRQQKTSNSEMRMVLALFPPRWTDSVPGGAVNVPRLGGDEARRAPGSTKEEGRGMGGQHVYGLDFLQYAVVAALVPVFHLGDVQNRPTPIWCGASLIRACAAH